MDGTGVYVVRVTPAATLPGQTSSGSNDAFVVKFDEGGPPVLTPPATQEAQEGTPTSLVLGSFTDPDDVLALACRGRLGRRHDVEFQHQHTGQPRPTGAHLP